MAVDSAGDLYVADHGNNRVLKLAAGSSTPSVLPSPASHPFGVAVDSAGTLYVADASNLRVLKLAAGSSTQAVLPFTGLNSPSVWRWTAAGDVYVTDRQQSGAEAGGGLEHPDRAAVHRPRLPHGVAVDTAGDLYVTDMSTIGC